VPKCGALVRAINAGGRFTRMGTRATFRRVSTLGKHVAGLALAGILITGCSSGNKPATPTENQPPTSQTPGAVTNLSAANVAAATIAGTSYFSSSKLAVSWGAPTTGAAPARYEITWTDQGTGMKQTVSATTTAHTIPDLKAKTAYTIDVIPCTASACPTSLRTSISGETPTEVWHLQGTGNSVAGLTRLVSDGNVRLHVMRYGTDAPSGLAGRLQLYYGPMGTTSPNLAVGVTSAAASQSVPATYLEFTSLTGSAGLISPPSAAPLVRQIATGQAVPVSLSLGGNVRLYFEASGGDNKTRIMYVESRDGYTGRDFNPGAPSTCSATADYSPGGGCAPTVVIGVEGDAVAGNLKIANARQFKIGYPTQSDWRWDGAPGTFMTFTTDQIAGCSTSGMNQGYAVWTGTAWQVQYASNGCPKLFTSMQAAHPLHVGGVRYKLYYGDPSDLAGKLGGQLPFLGPKKLIYADGALAGDPSRVDFEDWESASAGRRIVFLWPDGSPLNATALGYIDDFSLVAPTASMAWQVYYVAITDGVVLPFTAAAVLINP
jgi:hypothetical protein